MTEFIRQHIEIIGGWSTPILVLFLLCSLFLIWRLGRSGRFLIPRSSSGKLLSVTLVLAMIVVGVVLFLINGPLSPYIKTTYKLHRSEGQALPDITFRLVADDSTRKISDFRGQVVVLNLWATWCPPCVREMNTLNQLYASHKTRGVAVVTLSDEPRARLLQFATKHPMETISGYVSSYGWVNLETFRPYTLIIDKNGILREHIFGALDYDSFVRTVEKYVSEE
jgi:cytochrome c biogenesis protein CcmG, thiol:disulfide interchange protein DsbE